MAVRPLPRGEQLVIAYLTDHPDVVAVCDGEVATDLPATPAWPFVRVSVVAGTEVVRGHADRLRVQIEAWSDSRLSALDTIRIVRAAALDMPGVHPTAIVDRVRTVMPPRWLPDTTGPDPRPRYVMDIEVAIHQLPAV